MNLVARLIGTEKPKMNIHGLISDFAEYRRDPWDENIPTRKANIKSEFDIAAGVESDQLDRMLTVMTDRITALRDDLPVSIPVTSRREIATTQVIREFEEVFMLGERHTYNESQITTRLDLEPLAMPVKLAAGVHYLPTAVNSEPA